MKTETQEIVFDFCAKLRFEEGADGERELVGIENIELRLFDKRPDGSIVTENFIPLRHFITNVTNVYLNDWLCLNYSDLIESAANQEREIERKQLIQELEEANAEWQS